MAQQIVKDIPYYQAKIDQLKVHLETCSNPDTIAIFWNSINLAYRKIAELRLAQQIRYEEWKLIQCN